MYRHTATISSFRVIFEGGNGTIRVTVLSLISGESISFSTVKALKNSGFLKLVKSAWHKLAKKYRNRFRCVYRQFDDLYQF
jgi:hypothetical protein